MHATLRAVSGLRSLRNPVVFARLRDALCWASRRGFRIVHFSVQSNHVHLFVEADDKRLLSRGMQGLAVRLARTFNRTEFRRGAVWGDRYHAHELTKPREVRNALVYILQNHRKHVPGATGMDTMSSAMWFPGWTDRARTVYERWARARPHVVVPWQPPAHVEAPGLQGRHRAVARPCPVAPPATWLARIGWLLRGGGPIALGERPVRRGVNVL